MEMKWIHKGENILNVPNLLSFYRLIMVPVLLVFSFTGNERLFIIFICISLITDVMDGFIARNFKFQTRFGQSLDNIADVGTITAALVGIYQFKWEAFRDHAWLIYLFLAVFILSYIVAFIRFKKIPGLHLYLSVTSGYIQGIFLFILFAWDFYLWLFVLAMVTGILAYVEKILVLFKLEDIRTGVKGLYWLLKEDD
jgi:cardiolipin synthase